MSPLLAPEVLNIYRKAPDEMVRRLFGVEPYPWQVEALRAFAEPVAKKRIAQQSYAGPGKTANMAWMGINFLLCYGEPGHYPKGAVTSCNWDNLRDNLWVEYAKWIEMSPLLKAMFAWEKERIYARERPAQWFLSARSYSRSADVEAQGRTLSGIHGRYVLMQVDESGDTNLAVAKSAEQAMGGEDCKWARIVQSGNPISHASMLFAAATTLAHQWHIIRITGDPDDPACARRNPSDIAWARDQINTHGRDNPWVMAYILGKFPPTSINSLLGPDEVAEAMRRNPPPESYATSQRRLGVDVARFGLDPTIIFPRQGLMVWPCDEMRGARTDAIAARVALAQEKFNSEVTFIDDTGGYGGGVIDALIRAGHSPVAVNYSSRASDPRYFNLRSEMIFRFVEWVKRGGALPLDKQLARELTTPTYWFEGGKFRVEEKEQIKKRLKSSTDRLDALAQTFMYPEMPTAVNELGQHVQRGGYVSEYDHLTRE